MKKQCIIFAAILSLLFSMVAIVGCQQEVKTAWPVPTLEPELEIPAHFITYTDESGLFSISYPPDWELNLEQMEASYQEVQKIVRTETGLSIEETLLLFLAGRRVDEALDPNVNITLTPNRDLHSLDDMAEQMREEAAFYEEYQPIKELRTTVGGKEAIIVDAEFVFPGIPGRTRSLQLFVIQDEVVWSITCSTGPEQFPAEEETLHQVARSFRILR